MTDCERHEFDVIVVGAGGAGLRAAIEAREQGLRTAIVCKSLFGKAHTVMAEGGIAASMGNVNSRDNWQVHFCDSLRGGKFLNNPRMVELHAKEAPQRVWELETYGALFDRTPEGKISQRNFGGHEYPRLAHVGDRTGLELIRTLQQKVVSLQQDDLAELGDLDARIRVFHELTVVDLLHGTSQGGTRAVAGVFGYWRESGRFVRLEAPSVVLATGGIGKSFKVTSNSWEYTGDGHAMALRAGASLINMEFVQFHPTGMIWPPSVKGILVTESVRGDGGVLRNAEGKRFMFNYVPEVFRGQYAESEDEADRWYDDPDNNKRPPELLPRDEVARAINNEVKEGRGSPHGGVYLDVSSRLPAEEIMRRLPSMHHQFKELADVDITAEPMEVGPTCHYVMGGVEVDADTGATGVPGLFAAGEVSGGMHGSNRLGGNSLSDLLVFGRRTGAGAAAHAKGIEQRPTVSEEETDRAAGIALAPFDDHGADNENPYTLQQDLQQLMNDMVGIIRREADMRQALEGLETLRARARHLHSEGHRQYNPGWHLALDLRNMLAVCECIARSAIERTESRGGHTRDDYPDMDSRWRLVNLACRAGSDGRVELTHQSSLEIRPDLLALFGAEELGKYLTAEEMASVGAPEPAGNPGEASSADEEGSDVSYDAKFRIWRGDADGGELADYTVEVNEGEVVLDAIHRLQATGAPDLAVRWNCKAGKCGSCSAEINGYPKLMCMTRLNLFEPDETITVTPMRTFPVVRDLVTDVSYNYEKARQMPAFKPPADLAPGEYRMQQADVGRSQEFRKCIECFLCQDVCHVIRDHEDNKKSYAGPRLFIRAAELAMHPLDARTDRDEIAREPQGVGLCNITKCCTEVCPEHITITDNAIIPMKERIADRRFDPLLGLFRRIRGSGGTGRAQSGRGDDR